MKKRFGIINNGIVTDAVTCDDITLLFRDIMIEKAAANGQALMYDPETGRARRIDSAEIPSDVDCNVVVDSIPDEVIQSDPILSLINTSASIKPDSLEMSDLKWKYLVRSAVRGKSILCVGAAGCGKTQAAKALAHVPITKEIEVTEEEYQILLKDLNVISVTKL